MYRIGGRPQKIVEDVKEWLERPIRVIEKYYYLPTFTVSLKPCGYQNAYSDPNAVICSELFAEFFEKQLIGAVYPIMFHEVAHTLLQLWGLPGYDNEDIADSFAAASLATTMPDYMDEFIKWLELQDSVKEAFVQLVKWRPTHDLFTESSKHESCLETPARFN